MMNWGSIELELDLRFIYVDFLMSEAQITKAIISSSRASFEFIKPYKILHSKFMSFFKIQIKIPIVPYIFITRITTKTRSPIHCISIHKFIRDYKVTQKLFWAQLLPYGFIYLHDFMPI